VHFLNICDKSYTEKLFGDNAFLINVQPIYISNKVSNQVAHFIMAAQGPKKKRKKGTTE